MAYYFFFFRRFWVKGLRHSETISDKKCYLSRSTRRKCNPMNKPVNNGVLKVYKSFTLQQNENNIPMVLG